MLENRILKIMYDRFITELNVRWILFYLYSVNIDYYSYVFREKEANQVIYGKNSR